MTEINNPELEDYQCRFVDSIRGVIQRYFYRKLPRLRILDAGCDVSGKQLNHLAAMTSGEVIGINVAQNFPSESAIRCTSNNVKMTNMDGMDMDFPDQSFDMVLSANVMEHVRDPEKYVKECCRVLKNSGVAYFETAPIWTSARGHHVHEDMVIENCPEERNYKNDGSVIPDWSHLSFSEEEMRKVLEKKLLPTSCDYILNYLYHSQDLNQKPWNDIGAALKDVFDYVSIGTWEANEPDICHKPQNTSTDWDVFGFSATCRKRELSAVSKRLIWRLRKLGL